MSNQQHRDPSQFPDGFYLRIARAYGVQTADQDDAIQEMKLAVWQGHDARHRLIDFMRRNTLGTWQRRGKKITQLANPQPLEEEVISAREEPLADLLSLAQALQGLSSREQSIFLLREGGYKFAEIGCIWGLSEVRVCHLYNRTVAGLRVEINRD